MTRDEWSELAERMVAWWPHYDWRNAASAGSLDLWFDDVADLEAAEVTTATTALYRTGREFPPNGAQIRAKVVELQADVPGFGIVWDRLHRAAGMFGARRAEEAIAWLGEWHPLAGELARTLTFREFCWTTEQEVFHGQARRSWEQLVRRHERDSTLVGLPSGGMVAVERANTGPRQIGDALKAVLPGDAA